MVTEYVLPGAIKCRQMFRRQQFLEYPQRLIDLNRGTSLHMPAMEYQTRSGVRVSLHLNGFDGYSIVRESDAQEIPVAVVAISVPEHPPAAQWII